MDDTITARCGSAYPHGAHWRGDTLRTGWTWCAGNFDVVTAVLASPAPMLAGGDDLDRTAAALPVAARAAFLALAIVDDLDKLPADSLPWSTADRCPSCRANLDDVHADGCTLPAGATFEPWTDEDTDELGAEMRAAAHLRRDAYARIVATARANRAARLDLWTAAELRHAAEWIGLVPDPTDPDVVTRQRELISMPLDERRIESSTYQSAHQAFEQRHAIATGAAVRWPLYALGLALVENRGPLTARTCNGHRPGELCR